MQMALVRAQLHAGASASQSGRPASRGPRLTKRPSGRAGWQLRRETPANEAVPAVGGVPPGSSGPTDGGSGGGGGDGGGGAAAGGAILAGRALESLPAEMAEALAAGKLPQEILQRFLDMDRNPFLSWLMKMGCAGQRGCFAICVCAMLGIAWEQQTTLHCSERFKILLLAAPHHAIFKRILQTTSLACLAPPPCSGFRERLLADPGFMIKVAIEVGIGVCTKTTAEYTKRGDDFKSQLDFVFANLVM